MGRARYVMEVSHENVADVLEAGASVCAAAFSPSEARAGSCL